MKTICLLFALATLVSCNNSKTSASSNDAVMFRDNPTHTAYAETSYDLVYDTRNWAFDAGSPVRSTPLIHGDHLFFGNTAGDFFCLDKKTAAVNWTFHTGYAVNSSPACQDGIVYFSDNQQTVYALKGGNGNLVWKFAMGTKKDYPWRFDYYQSSPVLFGNKLIIGGDDGNLYVLNRNNGKPIWKFKTNGLIRSTAAIDNGNVYFGDTEGIFYALDLETGKEKWNFKINGQPLDLDTLGFDRKAMLGAPVISDGKIIFGARDGFLYCLNAADGKKLWQVDHEVSWIISTVAVKDSFVVTGTSDGRFIQAVNKNTGKQIWLFHTPKSTWCSPLINNNRVYEGCADGQLYCLDLATGNPVSRVATNGIVYSSPVLNDSLIYVGSDDGHLYAFKGHPPVTSPVKEQYVYFDTSKVNMYFRTGGDIRIKEYLRNNGFKVINTDSLVNIMSTAEAKGKSIVFATDFFTKRITKDAGNSLLRKFLDAGGRIVLLGNNPLFFNTDPTERQINGQAKRQTDTLLDLDFGPPDTRAFGGIFSARANEKGKYFGIPDHWVSNFGIDKKKIDLSLGENENGQSSAFVKYYNNGGALVQIWMHPELPEHLDAIIKVAEWELNYLMVHSP